MNLPLVRPLPLIVMVWCVGGSLFSQTVAKPAVAASKAEPGLELAVAWKWWVAPPEKKEWGMPLPVALAPKTPGAAAPGSLPPAAERPETYEVKKGDALIKIARKFDMTVAQLKQFNDLKDDRIRVGQTLRIPTPGQVLTLVPPPPPPTEPKPETPAKKETNKPAPAPEPAVDIGGEAQRELDNVLLQVFLDREMFSPGMIDGKAGATFLKVSEIYQRTHADAASPDQLKAKAGAALKQPYTSYTLRAEDFKFINPPKDGPPPPSRPAAATMKKSTRANPPAPPSPPPTIDELVAADFLGYAGAWEFVAERFHCDEAFLHHINPQLKSSPVVGTEFQVPNVIPFEIEKSLDLPLQPAADPKKPVVAAVVLLSRLEISCDGKLIAVMPLASARPGLHGRGSWTVLGAIPQPRMATKHEPREIPKAKPVVAGDIPSAQPAIEPPLEQEQYLAPGPNNPVGIIWLNLAKSGSTEPLPYGLHGTSIPAQMRSLQGIGGLRLTNWDIARAARLLPAGTTLEWKAQ